MLLGRLGTQEQRVLEERAQVCVGGEVLGMGYRQDWTTGRLKHGWDLCCHHMCGEVWGKVETQMGFMLPSFILYTVLTGNHTGVLLIHTPQDAEFMERKRAKRAGRGADDGGGSAYVPPAGRSNGGGGGAGAGHGGGSGAPAPAAFAPTVLMRGGGEGRAGFAPSGSAGRSGGRGGRTGGRGGAAAVAAVARAAAAVVGEVSGEVTVGVMEMAFGLSELSGLSGDGAEAVEGGGHHPRAPGAGGESAGVAKQQSEITAAVAEGVAENGEGEAAAAPVPAATPTMMSREARDLIMAEGGLELWKV